MSTPQDIDNILRGWPYQAGVISARLITAHDKRQVVQMRIEMGVLQMELTGRPDGRRPGGFETYLDYLNSQILHHLSSFVMSEEQCLEVDQEFVQFYHRRICCLALREFRRAVDDANHSLALMDFVVSWSPDPEWTLSHEQHRPFVLFHRTQAVALAELQDSNPVAAIEEINTGLTLIQAILSKSETETESDEPLSQDELVNQLVQMKEALRQEYNVGKTLSEQLADAISAEEYERAAKIRDEIARLQGGHH